MKHLTRTSMLWALSLLLPSLAGCGDAEGGGSGGSSGTAGNAGTAGIGGLGGSGSGGAGATGGVGGTAGATALSGSFDLTLVGVQQQDPDMPSAPASEGAKLRLDLEQLAGSYRAVLTPRWGVPSALDVSETSAGLALSGAINISAQGVTDRWTSFSVPLDAAGDPTGTLSAAGTEDVITGDVITSTEISSGGTFAIDTTAPELRSVPRTRNGPPDQLLPWERIPVDMAEPVNPEIFVNNLEVVKQVTPSAPLGMTWDANTSVGTNWAGLSHVSGFLHRWDGIIGQDLEVRVAKGVPDRVGLTTAALVSPFHVFALPSGLSPIDFDTDTLGVGTWGASEILGGGLAGAVHPDCEQIGCLKIGPSMVDPCGGPRSGAAALLTVQSATAMRLRYRVMVLGDDGAGGPPLSLPRAFSVELAAPAVDSAVVTQPDLTDATWTALPSGTPRLSTEWRTLDVAIPSASTQIGFAIYPGSQVGLCSGGLVPPPVEMTVYIDRIELY